MEGFVRVDVVKASSKGKGQGANLNIPARIYESIGRPSTFALYLDERGRILLEPLRALEKPRVIVGSRADEIVGRRLDPRLGAQTAKAVLPTRFKEMLRSLGATTVRVAVRSLQGDTLALVEAGEGGGLYRIPLPVEEALREALEALGVEGEPPTGIQELQDAIILVEVDGLKARLYIIRP